MKCKHGKQPTEICWECHNEWDCYEMGPQYTVVGWVCIITLSLCISLGAVATVLHCFGII